MIQNIGDPVSNITNGNIYEAVSNPHLEQLK